MQKSDLQEQIAALYLRLNGYFTSGFIVHASEGEINNKGKHRSNRAEIDALAVRFPYNAEPEREVGASDYLQTSAVYTDLLICEVKGQDEQLQFNPGLRERAEAIHSVLKWAVCLPRRKFQGLLNLLRTYYQRNILFPRINFENS